MEKMTILIPVFNESLKIKDSVERILDFFEKEYPQCILSILVADDGSRDGTAEIVESLKKSGLPVELLSCGHRGKGAAVRKGLGRIDTGHVLITDADLSTPIREINVLLEAASGLDEFCILGSRGLKISGKTKKDKWTRALAGRIFNFVVREMTGLPFRDTQCGFKLLSRKAAAIAAKGLQTDGWSYDIDMLLLFRDRLPCVEVAVDWEYSDDSKIRLLRDSFSMLKELRQIRKRLVK